MQFSRYAKHANLKTFLKRTYRTRHQNHTRATANHREYINILRPIPRWKATATRYNYQWRRLDSRRSPGRVRALGRYVVEELRDTVLTTTPTPPAASLRLCPTACCGKSKQHIWDDHGPHVRCDRSSQVGSSQPASTAAVVELPRPVILLHIRHGGGPRGRGSDYLY